MSKNVGKNAMSASIYEERLNKLLKLLKAVVPYRHFDLQTRETFERAIHKLQTDSFEIVLIGEFQGGKSTTFNALCDGREISPMGIGVKTSACRITARNIVDPEEEERAEIRWKTDDEILLNMLDILRRHMSEEDYVRCSQRDGYGVFTNLSLQNEKDRELIVNALEKEWETYVANPCRYDPGDLGKLDLLYVASLNMRFHDDPTIKSFREKKVVKVEELKNFVQFPIDWSERWMQNTPDAFKPQEIAGTFIGDVQCYIHSPNLQRLGCVVTDCPGLFAGPWDTQIAQDAMLNADSIVYLLRGDKAIGQQDLNALREIRRLNHFQKLFFTINAKTSYERLEKAIRPGDVATINNSLGGWQNDQDGERFFVDGDDFYIFHALLAYMAKNRAWISDDSPELFAWKKKACRFLETFLDPQTEAEYARITTTVDNYPEILDVTKFNDLLSAVENATIRQKAYSLLMTNGALSVNDALDELESKLKRQEENATKSVEQTHLEAQNAEAALVDFQNRSREIVKEELKDEQSKEAIAEDFVKRSYLDSIPRLADNLFEKIDEIFSDGRESLKYLCEIIAKAVKEKISGPSKLEVDQFGKKIQAYVADAIKEECVPASISWFTSLKNCESSVYRRIVLPKLKLIGIRIEQIWTEVVVSSKKEGVKSYLEGISPNGLSYRIAASGVTRSFDSSGTLDAIRSTLIKRFATEIGATTAGVIAYSISVIVAAFIIAHLMPVGIVMFPIEIVTALFAILTGRKVYDTVANYFRNKIDAQLKAKLEPALRKAFEGREVADELNKAGQTAAEEVVDACKKYYFDEFDKQKRQFETNRDAALADKQKSLDEQLRIAEEARKIRKDVVQFRSQVGEFIDETRPYFEQELTNRD